MLRTKIGALGALIAMGAACLISCGMGAEPAHSDSGTILALRLGSGAGTSRAILAGDGYLYLRTWTGSVGIDGVLYGPYAVSGNDVFQTSDVPGEDYAAIDIILSASVIPSETLAAATDLAALCDSCEAIQGTASAYRIENPDIIPNRINVLDVTLVPLVENAGIAILDPILYTAAFSRSYESASKIARFFRIDGLPTSIQTERLALKVTAKDGTVALEMYRPDGSRAKGFAYDADSLEWRLAAPSDPSYYLLVTGEASSFDISAVAVPESVAASVTISFGNPSVPAVSGSGVTVTSLDTLTVTASAGFAEYVWKLNGETLAGAAGNVCAINLATAADAIVGANIVTLRVKTAGGEYYSASFGFTMTE